MGMHANGFHMNPVRAHLYTAWESESQRQLHFRLKRPQAYLYKPEHLNCKNILAISRTAVGYSSTTGAGHFRRALLRMLIEGVQLTALPRTLPHARISDRKGAHTLHEGRTPREHTWVVAALYLQDVLLPIEGASFLITGDRRSWLDAHAHDQRQTCADAAQCAPSVVCLAIKQPMSCTNEEVVVVGASHPATVETFAHLEGLYCRQRHHCLRELGLQLVKARLPDAYGYPCDGASAHTTG